MIAAVPQNLSDLLSKKYLLHRDIKPDSVEQLRITIRQFERWYAEAFADPFVLARLSDELVSTFLVWLRDEKKLAPKTLNRKRGDLLTLWRFAKKKAFCEHGPEDVIRFSEPKRNPTAWDQEELPRLLKACEAYLPRRPIPGWDGRHWKAIALVMYYTAYRFWACLMLRRCQLRKDGAIIADAEEQKTFCDEVGWLGADAMLALEAIAAESEYLFCFPYQPEAFWYHWRRILKAAGLPATRRDGPQKMRRTSATWMEAFAPGSATQHLGHKTPGLADKHYIDKRLVGRIKASKILPQIGGAQLKLF